MTDTRDLRRDVSPGRVAVVGSLNIDRILRVPRLPAAGETILASGMRQDFGGKGANQAVAAARYGAAVSMVGAIGGDADGEMYRRHLIRERISVDWLAAPAGCATGSAFIAVDANGENNIVVDQGANRRLEPAHVQAALKSLLPATDILLVGLECSAEVAIAAIQLAKSAGVRSIFNPSPAPSDFPWPEAAADVVVVNQQECTQIFGPAEPRALHARQIRHLVVTCGARPTRWVSAAGVESIPTSPVEPCDTVGAGDTFAGVLAAALAENAPWDLALRHANAAAALSTLAVGAQTAMPRRSEVLALTQPPVKI